MTMRCGVVRIELVSVDRWLDHGVRSGRGNTVISVHVSADGVMMIDVNITVKATMILIVMLTMRIRVRANNWIDAVVCRILSVRRVVITDDAV